MTQPLTHADMRRLWRDGEPLASIAAKARLRNGLTKDEVRRIVFAEECIGERQG